MGVPNISDRFATCLKLTGWMQSVLVNQRQRRCKSMVYTTAEIKAMANGQIKGAFSFYVDDEVA